MPSELDPGKAMRLINPKEPDDNRHWGPLIQAFQMVAAFYLLGFGMLVVDEFVLKEWSFYSLPFFPEFLPPMFEPAWQAYNLLQDICEDLRVVDLIEWLAPIFLYELPLLLLLAYQRVGFATKRRIYWAARWAAAILWRRKEIVAVGFAAGIGFAILAIHLAPKEYESRAVIRLNKEQINRAEMMAF